MIETIKKLAKTNNIVNLGRSLEVRYPDIFNYIIQNTQFLPSNCKFTERVYCLVNNITIRLLCPYTDIPRRFINYTSGYSKTHNSVDYAKLLEKSYSSNFLGDISTKELEFIKKIISDGDIELPHYISHFPELSIKIIQNTKFLDRNSSFTERLYCLTNRITELMLDESGNRLSFINYYYGYHTYNQKALLSGLEKEYLEYAKLVGSDSIERGQLIRGCVLGNQKLNEHLYLDDTIEGYDYVICPITNSRKEFIKKSYIEDVLGLNWEDFLKQYPDIKLMADIRYVKISNSLKEIDEESGLTKHELCVQKSRITSSKIGDDGLTVDQRRGKKLKEIHTNKIDENGLNGYQRIAKVARSKQIRTMHSQGRAISPNERYEWKAYRSLCDWLTAPHKSKVLNGRLTGRAGTPGAFQVDHRYTAFDGYKNKISPFLIADKNNLQALPWGDNLLKNRDSSSTIELLLKNCNYDKEKSESEFNLIINIILEMKNNKEIFSSIKLFEEFNKRTTGHAKFYKK
jgi:hypothetical protein